jgi:alpha-L-rhamnosidase
MLHPPHSRTLAFLLSGFFCLTAGPRISAAPLKLVEQAPVSIKRIDDKVILVDFGRAAFDLEPEGKGESIAKWMAGRGMRCSVYAARYFMEALFENGQSAAALKLMTADNDRSWKHMADSGTTITWEAWDMKYKPNQDWNHAWGAAPANLLPRYVLGVEHAKPGWELASIRPYTGELTHSPRARSPRPAAPF